MDFNANIKIGVVFGVLVKYTRFCYIAPLKVKPKQVDKDLEITEEEFIAN